MHKITYKMSGYITEQWVSGIIGNGQSVHAVKTFRGKTESLCGTEHRYTHDMPVSILEHQQINCKKCLAKLRELRATFGVSDWQEE